MSKTLRFAVVGASRGMSFAPSLDALGEFGVAATLSAICDIDESALARCKQERPGLRGYTSLDKLLSDDAADAVLVASPMQIHAEQSLACLRAGKHVLCEVPACLSDTEARALVKAARARGAPVYMMSENYCYTRPHLMVLNMVRQGLFGDLTFAEGMYLHDCRTLFFRPKTGGKETWRGDIHGHTRGNTYPTHSLGPIAQWLDLGPGRADAIASIYSASTRPLALADFSKRSFGDRHAGADPSHWQKGDSTSCILRTKLGRVISLRLDVASSRPHNMAVHELQGTRACFRTEADPQADCLLWIEGRSKGRVVFPDNDIAAAGGGEHLTWEPYTRYAKEYEHPLWQKLGEPALKSGHGGGDLIVLSEFIRAINQRERPPIDVLDATHWSSVYWLSGDSELTGQAVQVPDYSTP